MNRSHRLALAFVATAFFAQAALAAPLPYSEAGAYGVKVDKGAWKDEARAGRTIKYVVYSPVSKGTPTTQAGAATQPSASVKFPLVIFSHGLGGSANGYSYFGNHFASHGYVVVHVQHVGSDIDVLLNAPGTPADKVKVLQAATKNPLNALNRPKDVSFAIDRMVEANGDSKSPLHGRIDAEKIAVAGHSFGGFTSLAIAGRARVPGSGVSLGDKRVKACIAISPPGQAAAMSQYSGIAIPTLVMSGTLDGDSVTTGKPQDRRDVFEALDGCDHYWLNLTGGDHMVFSGPLGGATLGDTRGGGGGAAASQPASDQPARRRAMAKRNPAQDASHLEIVRSASLAFANAMLKGDVDSREYLQAKDGLEKAVTGRAEWEYRTAGK